MKADVRTAETGVSHPSRWNISPAPSLRVPVTAANRALLRRLRAAELSAWEAGRAGGYDGYRGDPPAIPVPPGDHHF
jgi:hypothetical protein